MIGTFGPVTFTASAELLRTFSGLQRQGEARFASHEVAVGKPLLEFLGPGLDEVSFSMAFDVAHGLNPRAEIDSLREIRDKGLYYSLVLDGRPLGRFAAVSLTENWDRVDQRGRLLSATVAVALREYVDAKV